MHTRHGDVFAITLTGLSASLVHVTVTIEHDEFGTFELAGLDEDSWELTRRRVAPAIYNTLKRNDLEIAVEITPTGTNNHGGQLDLAIAVAVLLAFERKSLPSTVVLGELSRSGEVRHVRGILPALRAASTSHAIRHAIVPRADTAEAAHAGLDVRVVDHLGDVLDSLRGSRVLAPAGPRRSTRSYERDLAEKPFMMASVRRALEIAAAGQHPLLIIGGAGRMSAALKLPALLLSMTTDEAIEVTSIYSIAGLLEAKQGLLASRPIRLPNYRDATLEKFLGRNDPACPGGVRPGEVSLAHGGVLFLDELLEFRRSDLAALAVALDKGESSGFPARPLLVGAACACPCGFRGDEAIRPCTCTRTEIERHERRLRAVFDRYFDMQVVLPPVFDVAKPERSEVVRRRVTAARAARAAMAPESETALWSFAQKCGVLPSNWPKVLRVARTIAALADISGVRAPRRRQVYEAIQSSRDTRTCNPLVLASDLQGKRRPSARTERGSWRTVVPRVCLPESQDATNRDLALRHAILVELRGRRGSVRRVRAGGDLRASDRNDTSDGPAVRTSMDAGPAHALAVWVGHAQRGPKPHRHLRRLVQRRLLFSTWRASGEHEEDCDSGHRGDVRSEPLGRRG